MVSFARGYFMKIVYEHLQGLRRQTGLFDGVMYGAHMLSCIGAWRLTKDIIRLDETVKDTIISTQFTGDLPVDLFFPYAIVVHVCGIYDT